MFKNTNRNVGNCRVQTEAERNELAQQIFNKKVDGYWINVNGEIIATKTLREMLTQVAGKEKIKRDVEINHKFGVWGEVGILRQYTPRQFIKKFGEI